MRLCRALATTAVLVLSGCHSAYVSATILNSSGKAVTLVELDYPSASFGVQTLASGQKFTYRFKVLGSGNLKLLWTDSHMQEQHADGPRLQEGAEGPMVVTLEPGSVQWTLPPAAEGAH